MGSALGVGVRKVTVTVPLSLLLDQTPSMADISTTDTTQAFSLSNGQRIFHTDIVT